MSKQAAVTVERIACLAIVLATPDEADEICAALQAAGVRLGDDVVEASIGIRSRMFPIAGGGFVEVACELSPGSFPHGPAFAVTPRIGSIGYTTDDAAADMARWRELPDGGTARAQAGGWRREDGTMGYYVGIAPAPFAADVFFGLREVRLFPLPYADGADDAPVLRRVEIRGGGAERWRERHVQLFDLPQEGGVVRAGATDVAFEQVDGASTEISIELAVDEPAAPIALVAGGLSFIPR